jgi:hypothetical protein
MGPEGYIKAALDLVSGGLSCICCSALSHLSS